MHPLVTPILFAIVASPSTYKLTRSIGGDWIASSDGHAKMGGLILHAIVMAILLRFVWKTLKSKKSGYQYARSNLWGGGSSQTGWGGIPMQDGGTTNNFVIDEMDDTLKTKGYPIDGSDVRDKEYMD